MREPGEPRLWDPLIKRVDLIKVCSRNCHGGRGMPDPGPAAATSAQVADSGAGHPNGAGAQVVYAARVADDQDTLAYSESSFVGGETLNVNGGSPTP